MKRKALALFMAGCVVFTTIPINAYAGEMPVIEEGETTDSLDSEAKMVGFEAGKEENASAYSGVELADEEAAYELIITDNVVTGYTGTPVNVVIPENVTEIGIYAFFNCSSLESIELPTSVITIGWQAFRGCKSLESIELSTSMTEIGEGAFRECSSLESIELPASVTTIGDGTFWGCSSLESIELPESITKIGGSAFYGCSKLTSIDIPTGVSEIGGAAFSGCKSLTSIKIPTNVTEIGTSTFMGCSSLESIEIPESITEIGGHAFMSCSSLTSVKIPTGVTAINEFTFYNCNSLTSIEIPTGVTEIGMSAFQNCKNLESIKIPTSVTKIEEYAFHVTKWLENRRQENPLVIVNHILIDGSTCEADVKIPTGVTAIGKYAFERCSGLTSIEIPSSITEIGGHAFVSCSSLTSIKMSTGVTEIGKYVFFGCSSLTSIKLPTSVTTIGTWTFDGCSNLTSIEIPSSVTTIGTWAFDGCSNLTIYGKTGSYAETYAKEKGIPFVSTDIATKEVYMVTFNANGGTSLSTSKKEIEKNQAIGTLPTVKRNGYIFQGWYTAKTGGTKVTEKNVVTADATLYAQWEKEGVSIKQATIKLSKTSYTYDGTAKKPTVTVKLGKKTLAEGTDYGVSYTKNKNIGTATVTITGKGSYTGNVSAAFSIKVKKGTTFTSGKNKYKVTGTSTAAFNGIASSKTTKITIPKTVKYGGKTFKVTTIANGALKKKTKITSVTIGANVMKLDKQAFYGCKNLKTITIKSTKLKNVGKEVFKGINSKAAIKVPKSKLSSYKKLLKGKGQGSKVKIVKY